VVLKPAVIAAGAIFAVGALTWLAPRARAATPPDSAQLAHLQAACSSAWRVRLIATRATYLLARPSLSAGGVSITRRVGRPALFTIGDLRDPERRIRWADVERLDAGSSAIGRGAMMGAVFGALVGTVVVSSHGPDLADSGDHVILFAAVLFGLGSTTLGALLGAANPHLRPLYP
jgi:hypothetical protein